MLGQGLLGVRVVTVSGGSWLGDVPGVAVEVVLADVLGVGRGVLDSTGRGVGAPMVALVVALSPLLMMTAVAIAPIATTAPRSAVTGRQRRSAGQASSS